MHRERGVFSDLRIVTGSELVIPFQEEEFSLPGQLNEDVCSLHVENRKVQLLTDWEKKKWIIRKICPYTNQWYHRFEYCIQVRPPSLRKKKKAQREHTAKGQNALAGAWGEREADRHFVFIRCSETAQCRILRATETSNRNYPIELFPLHSSGWPKNQLKLMSEALSRHSLIGGEKALAASHPVHAQTSLFSPCCLEQGAR